jgi:hypothetical protein
MECGSASWREPWAVSDERFAAVANLSTRRAAQRLGDSHTVVAALASCNQTRQEAVTKTADLRASA